MKKGNLKGFLIILIGLVLCLALVLLGYEAVTGVKIAAVMAGNVAQDTAIKFNTVMLAPNMARIMVDCPPGYEIEINNARISVRLEKFGEDETVSAYYLVPKGAVLPENLFIICNKTNFISVRKWRTDEGNVQLAVEAMENYTKHKEIDWGEVSETVYSVEVPGLESSQYEWMRGTYCGRDRKSFDWQYCKTGACQKKCGAQVSFDPEKPHFCKCWKTYPVMQWYICCGPVIEGIKECSGTADGVCPDHCSAGVDYDCCVESGDEWWDEKEEGVCGMKEGVCEGSCSGIKTCEVREEVCGCYEPEIKCSKISDGVCPDHCSAGVDYDCCVNAGKKWVTGIKCGDPAGCTGCYEDGDDINDDGTAVPCNNAVSDGICPRWCTKTGNWADADC